MNEDNLEPTTTDESAQLLGLMRGFVVSQTLYVAASLGIADHLAGGARQVDDLALEVNADPDALYRVLRALSSLGIFEEKAGKCFSLTRLALPLCSSVPGSLRHWFLTNGGPIYAAFAQAMHSVRTGQPAFDRVYGRSFFDYLREEREEGRIFSSAMREFTRQTHAGVLAAYDFSRAHQVVDIGGGDGALVLSLLKAFPTMEGTVFDLPEVIAGAASSLDAVALAERVRFVGGDFFEEIPPDADLYLMTWILHDWTDERAVAILRRCRSAMPAHARLLVIEAIVPEGNGPDFSKFGDIVMMVLFGSRERTETEYRSLLEAGGFKMVRIIRTGTPRSIIEAVPAAL